MSRVERFLAPQLLFIRKKPIKLKLNDIVAQYAVIFMTPAMEILTLESIVGFCLKICPRTGFVLFVERVRINLLKYNTGQKNNKTGLSLLRNKTHQLATRNPLCMSI